MSDDANTPILDAIGTTGGKATVAPRRTRRDLAELLGARELNKREDAVLGEIVRICVGLDKAGFAKVYATAKAEQQALDDRHEERLRRLYTDADPEPEKPRDP